MTLSIAKGRKHRFALLMSGAAMTAMMGASPAYANPSGGKVTAGSASIVGEGTGRVTIQQNSDKAVIDWQSFGIAAGESTTFAQPGTTSIALNRVTGGDVSTILGELNANGRVFLINPNGILFGESARVDVGGLVATTADISNEAFMAGGALRFGTPGKAGAQVINQGQITVRDAGIAAFVAPQVVNDGVITARLGKVALGGAESFTLDLHGDNLIRFQVGDEVTSTDRDGALVEVGGVIDASGGSLMITASAAREVVNQSVRIGDVESAGGARVNADGSVSLTASRVALAGSGEIETGRNVSIDLSSASNGGSAGDGARGGTLSVSADRTILDGTINLDGDGAGGSANISGSDFLSFGSILSTRGREVGGGVRLSAGSLSLAGQIVANSALGYGGNVNIHANGRAIDTSDAFVDATGLHGGSISYTSDSQIISSGKFRASGTYGFGGTIDMTAPRLDLFSGQYYAQGGVQGGRIRLGGEYQGGKGLTTDELANASNLVATDGVVIDASAIGQRGMGGDIVVWSDEKTTFLGTVRSQGGLFGGNGGNIEISGAQDLLYAGTVETARSGMRGGNLLLDPKNITIAETPPSQYALVLNALNVTDDGPLEGGDINFGDQGDRFGDSVSLDGTRLAVGAATDDGAGNGNGEAGAVYLFSFADLDFSAPKLESILGAGYSGGKNFSIFAGLSFGASVSLDGNQLAVGSTGQSAIYLFSFADATFSTPTLHWRVGVRNTMPGEFQVSGLQRNDSFGASVSLDGNRLAAGALNDDGLNDDVLNAGAVYLFRFDDQAFTNLRQESILGADYIGGKNLDVMGLQKDDKFGVSVSLDGDRVAVGAIFDDGANDSLFNPGAVYLFSFADAAFSTPILESTLGNGYSGGKNLAVTDLAAFDAFGNSVSLDGNRLAVGAGGDDGLNNGTGAAGAVRLFSFTNATFSDPEQQSILGNGYSGGKNLSVGSSRDDRFGFSVSLDGNRLAVGTPGDDGEGNSVPGSGSVRLFTFTDALFSGPAQVGTFGAGYTSGVSLDLTQSVSALDSDDAFGTSVSLDGNRLAVGASLDDGASNGFDAAGAVYLFSFADAAFSTPTLEGILGAGYSGGKNLSVTDLEAGDQFGSAVSLDGNQLTVGATLDDGAGNTANDSGAVYLFSFANAVFSTPTLQGILGAGYGGSKDLDVSGLEDSDLFGSSVSLDNNRLAVGASLDDGAGNTANDSGAVYLFSFADALFSNPTQQALFGAGYSGNNNLDVNDLGSFDAFGSSVSLDGNRLAVGARGDGGAGDTAIASGAAYLFSFADPTFSTPMQEAKFGLGYSGGKSLAVTDLEAGDQFGTSVSLEDNRLAVGADSDDGAGNAAENSGAVYLFGFADADFSNSQLESKLGSGYGGGPNLSVTALEADDRFGISVSLDADRLAVGASGDDGSGNALSDSGTVYLFDLAPPALGSNLYADNPASDVTISPGSLTAILNGGTNVTLQANNDIFVNDAVTANNPAGNSGGLILQAGRSIFVNAGITTDNGLVALFANDQLANGVIDANRDPGAAEISFGPSGFVDAGTGLALIRLLDGAGKTNLESGQINLGSITASAIEVINEGASAGSGVTINAGAVLSASGANNAIIISGDSFTNNAGAGAFNLTGSGRFLVYSNDWDTDTRGGLIGNNLYNRSFVANGPGAITQTGNMFIYERQPILTFTANDAAREYGLANPVFSSVFTGLVNGDSAGYAFNGIADLTTAATSGTAVGTVPINASLGSLSSDVGYGFAFAPGSLLITKALLNVQADNKARQYGLVNPLLTSTITGFRNGDNSSVISGLTLATVATQASDVGSYAITASGASATNYDFAFVPGTLSITKALLNVVVDDQTREYGLANSPFTADIFGFANADNASVISGLVLSTLATQGSEVGSYAITASGASATNYDFAYTPGTLSITKALLNVTADDQTREYGLVNPLLTSSIAGFRNGDDSSVISGLTLATAATQGSDVGSYAITAAGARATNYDFTYAPGTLTITKALLNITADDQTREYGLANPLLTSSITGFRNGETFATSGVTGAAALATAAGQGSDVGTYTITASMGNLAAGNYDFAFVPGTLLITKALLNVVVDDQAREYGLSNSPFTADIFGFANADNASVISGLVLSTLATQGSDVGSYAITASGASATNYDFAYTPGILSITKALLNVTADDQTREYGLVNPLLTSSIAGFRNSDDSSVISGLTLATAATQGSDVGSYAITAAGASATNYDFAFAPGTLMISKALLSINAEDQTREYGLVNPLLTSSIAGFRNGDDSSVISGLTLATAATQGSDVGSYAITAAGASATNYDFTYAPGTLTITKALLSVAADDQTREYGLINPLLTSTITGFRNGDDISVLSGLTLATAATQGSDVGSYAITASGASATNYDFAYAPGILTITKALLNIRADDKTREYGLPNPPLTSTITGFRNGDNASVISGLNLATTASLNSLAGRYPIIASGANAVNYSFAYSPGTLSVLSADRALIPAGPAATGAAGVQVHTELPIAAGERDSWLEWLNIQRCLTANSYQSYAICAGFPIHYSSPPPIE